MSDNKRKEGDEQVPTPSAAEKPQPRWLVLHKSWRTDGCGNTGQAATLWLSEPPEDEHHRADSIIPIELPSKHSGQAVDKQGEWTVERSEEGVSNPMARIMQGDKVILGWTMRPFSELFDKIVDAHNSALTANDEQWRERFRKFEKIEEKFGPASQRIEGQAVDRQGWTVNYRELITPTGNRYVIEDDHKTAATPAKRLKDEINAALAAERQRADKLRTDLEVSEGLTNNVQDKWEKAVDQLLECQRKLKSYGP